jgi:cobalt-zinc-cadmium efflux system membrane fusion protein
MNHFLHKLTPTIALLLLLSPLTLQLGAQDDHSGHDHAATTTYNDGHDHGNEAGAIQLASEHADSYSIKIETAKTGSIKKEIQLSGEIKINENKLVHHVSRATGIISEINVSTGDYVRKNEVLAIIDSAELGQAKSEFYEIFNQVAISNAELRRFTTVAANTERLLDYLKEQPEIASLQKNKFGDMGDYGAELLKSYAELSISNKNFKRKERLFKDKIVSENDFLNAQNNFEKALANYAAARDNISFEIKQRLFDYEKSMKVYEFKLRTAERKLQLLGLTAKEINKIRTHGAEIQNTCLDPACPESGVSSGNHSHKINDNSFSQLQIKASRSGTVIFRNAGQGEEVEKNKILFSVADLSSLWAVLQVSARDYPLIRQGMEVTIQSADGMLSNGRVLLLYPVMEERTRSVGIRVSLNNDNGKWIPGSFVTGHIKIFAENLPVVVPRNAVQSVNGQKVVFIPASTGFNPVDVVTGKEDSENIEIRSGLHAGQKYVAAGAFILKSIMLTSGMDPHAGHGH